MSPPIRYATLAILAAALAVRLAAGVWWQNRQADDQSFAFGDSETYWALAETIARGQPYEYGPDRLAIFRTPGYPALLAPLFLVWREPPVLAARALSALLGTASVAITMGLARSLLDDRAALVSGVMTALDPGIITLGVFVLSEAPFTPLMMLALWSWTLAWRATDVSSLTWQAALSGVFSGLAVLMRPSWLLFVPFALAVGLLASSVSSDRLRLWKRHLQIGAVMVAALGVALGPWWLRNYSITGRFVPTTLQVGPSLYDGLGPQADGSSNMEFVNDFVERQKTIDGTMSGELEGTFEERLDSAMRNASIAWAKEHPQRVLELVGIKFVRIWTLWPNASDVGGFWAKLAIAVGYVPILVLGLYGAWKFSSRDWSFALLLLPAIYFTLLHVIFVGSIRYRQPAMLPLAILASAAALQLFDHFRISLKTQTA